MTLVSSCWRQPISHSLNFSISKRSYSHATSGSQRGGCGGDGCYYDLQQHIPKVLLVQHDNLLFDDLRFLGRAKRAELDSYLFTIELFYLLVSDKSEYLLSLVAVSRAPRSNIYYTPIGDTGIPPSEILQQVIEGFSYRERYG